MEDFELDCGSWTLVREIGHGAYGVVYMATNRVGEAAALKVCRRDALDGDRYERELRGAKVYKTIPPVEGLVRMLELGERDWGFYVVMELADDEFGAAPSVEADYRPKTLSRVIDGEKALPIKAALKLGISLATGLEMLQRHHLLHRDIKPGNVIYVHGRPVLSDFGLLVGEAEAASLVGTPGYVPPENFTEASGDVYSLGLTLKAASFGRSVDELDLGPTLEADTGNRFFAAWWRILNKATHPDLAYRYRSAKALLKDLTALQRKMSLSTIFSKSPLAIVLKLLLVVAIVMLVLKLFIYKRVREDMPNVNHALEASRRAVEHVNKTVDNMKKLNEDLKRIK